LQPRSGDFPAQVLHIQTRFNLHRLLSGFQLNDQIGPVGETDRVHVPSHRHSALQHGVLHRAHHRLVQRVG